MTARLFSLPLLLAVNLAAAQDATVQLVDQAYPLEAYPQEAPDGSSWVGCRVVDAVSGLPIVGAELLLVAEGATPVPGEFSFLRRAESDADGFVRLPLEREGAHWTLLRAPGYGAASAGSGLPARVWALAPAVDLPVRLLDWLERPAPGAAVGLCLGCGHTPDVARAQADANGVAVLRGVDPHNSIADLYPDHPGLGIDDYDGVSWVPGDPPADVRASYAVALRGRLLDPEGQPVAGAFVGNKTVHRGPWTTTAADGTFQLNPSLPGYDLYVVRPEQPDHEYLFELADGRDVSLQLPEPSAEACQVIDLPDAQVPTPSTHEPRLVLPVDAPAGAQVALLHRGDRADVSAVAHAGKGIAVPGLGEFGLEISDGEQHRVLVFSDLAERAPEPVELRFLPPTAIRARLVDGAGRALSARVDLLPPHALRNEAGFDLRSFEGNPCADGNLALESLGTGLHWLAVRPADAALQPRLLPLHLPARASAARLELGELVFTGEPRLRILDSAGTPYAGPPAGLLRAGWSDVRDGPTPFALDDQGAWQGPQPRAGDALVVPAADWDLDAQPDPDGIARLALPYRQVLQGAGPWTLRVPAGELRLDANDSAGRALDARLYVADRSIVLRGPLLLGQLPTGPLELIVAAAGHRSARATVAVPATGRVELALVLPQR